MFFKVTILRLNNAQHVLDRLLTEKSAKFYLCLTSENGENHYISISLCLKFTYAVWCY